MIADSTQENTVVMLLGNQSETKKQREVTYQEALQYAKLHNYNYMEVSAKTRQNIEQAFQIMATEIDRK